MSILSLKRILLGTIDLSTLPDPIAGIRLIGETAYDKLVYIQYSPCGVSGVPRDLDSDFGIIPPRVILPSGEAGPEIDAGSNFSVYNKTPPLPRRILYLSP